MQILKDTLILYWPIRTSFKGLFLAIFQGTLLTALHSTCCNLIVHICCELIINDIFSTMSLLNETEMAAINLCNNFLSILAVYGLSIRALTGQMQPSVRLVNTPICHCHVFFLKKSCAGLGRTVLACRVESVYRTDYQCLFLILYFQ